MVMMKAMWGFNSYNSNSSSGQPRRYPLELKEIAEIIASGKPAITIDDICDAHNELWSDDISNSSDEDESKLDPDTGLYDNAK